MVLSLELPVADDYTPSDGELNNFVYLVCKYTVGWQMRSADLAVCLMMAGGKDNIVGNAGLSRLCETTCEYLWDHICGEPEEASGEAFFEHIKPLLQRWYNEQNAEERSDLS